MKKALTEQEKDLTKEPGAGYLGTIMLKTREGNYIMQQLIISKDGEDKSKYCFYTRKKAAIWFLCKGFSDSEIPEDLKGEVNCLEN